MKICDPSRYQAMIDPELCSFCGPCQDRCYFNALEEVETGQEVMKVVAEKCMGCGLCHVTCPEEAISMVEDRVPDFIPA